MNNTLFIDIETVPQTSSLKENLAKDLFIHKFRSKFDGDPGSYTDEFKETLYKENAALYAEFGKIVCVVIGHFKGDQLRVKTIASKHEKQILTEVSKIMSGSFAGVVAHNGKEFDYPYLFRRMIINEIQIPPILNTINKKPWEVSLFDTMEMWSGTQWKYRCGLELLAHCLGLPSPKSDMDGSQVAEVYYSMFEGEANELPFDKEESVLKRIGEYCQKDVTTLANVYFRLIGAPILSAEQIVYV